MKTKKVTIVPTFNKELLKQLKPGKKLTCEINIVSCPDPRQKGLWLMFPLNLGVSHLIPIPGTLDWDYEPPNEREIN